MEIIRWNELDEMLSLLRKHDVESCHFTADGKISLVTFRMRFDNQPQLSPSLKFVPSPDVELKAGYEATQADNPYKDELLELALNLPSDIRYPVDDGKD